MESTKQFKLWIRLIRSIERFASNTPKKTSAARQCLRAMQGSTPNYSNPDSNIKLVYTNYRNVGLLPEGILRSIRVHSRKFVAKNALLFLVRSSPASS